MSIIRFTKDDIQGILESVIEAHEKTPLETVVVVAKTEDGQFMSAHSNANVTELVGMLEMYKLEIASSDNR